jgi:cholesterol transport system auxiliary component
MNPALLFRLHMKHPTTKLFTMLVLGTSMLSGCSSLLPANAVQPKFYSFDDSQSISPRAHPVKAAAPTLVLATPRAAAGFDSQQMIYLRQPHKLEYFRESEWVNAPAVMLSPLVAAALEDSGAFAAVVQSPTSVSGQFRLELELIRLQQEFINLPSREHFTLRAHLLNPATHQVIAWREFDVTVPAPTDDPYGGVIAANQAVRTVIAQLVPFCAEAISGVPQTRP